jgi:hypothetical protein
MRGILSIMLDNLSGPKQVNTINPQTGAPETINRSTGQRVMTGIGNVIGGMSAGLANSRGPGGAFRAANAAFNKEGELQQEETNRRNQFIQNNLTLYQAYKQHTADEAATQAKNTGIAAPLVEDMRAFLSSGKSGDAGELTNVLGTETLAKIAELHEKYPYVFSLPTGQDSQGRNQFSIFYGNDLPNIKLTAGEATAAQQGIANGAQAHMVALAHHVVRGIAQNNLVHQTQSELDDNPFRVGKAPLPFVDQDGKPIDRDKLLAGLSDSEHDRVQDSFLQFSKLHQKFTDPASDLAKLRAAGPAGSQAADDVEQFGYGPGNAEKIHNDIVAYQQEQERVSRNPDLAVPSPAQRRAFVTQLSNLTYLNRNKMAQGYIEEVNNEQTLSGAVAAVTRAENMNAQLMAKEQAEKDRALQRSLSDNPLDANTLANVAQAGYEGRIEMSPSYLRSKQGAQVLARIADDHPDFDQSKAMAYFKTRQEFTSGKTSASINAYNTAINHLATMMAHTQNSNIADINNPLSQTHRQLELDKQLVSMELTKAVTNGQMTQSERDGILGAIAGNTVASYRQRVQEGAQLLKGKLDAWQNQWQTAKPSAAIPDFPMISPESKTNLLRISTGKMNIPSGATKVVNGPDKLPHFTNDTGTVDLGVVK